MAADLLSLFKRLRTPSFLSANSYKAVCHLLPWSSSYTMTRHGEFHTQLQERPSGVGYEVTD